MLYFYLKFYVCPKLAKVSKNARYGVTFEKWVICIEYHIELFQILNICQILTYAEFSFLLSPICFMQIDLIFKKLRGKM